MESKIHEAALKGYQIAGDSYEKGRPEYPKTAIDFLTKALDLKSGVKVLDLAAGTGKFTKLIISTSADITAVEPVEGMRRKFTENLPNISIINGAAEAIPFKDESFDVVVAAQAFHWFDGEKALVEIYRVLKSGGSLAMIWNVRDESIDWISKLAEIIDPFENGAPRYKSNLWKSAFETTKLFSPLVRTEFNYDQLGDLEMVLNRVGSISFISALPSLKKEGVLFKVKELLGSHPQTKILKSFTVPYETHVYICSKI